jgi:hypothetical protein
MSQRRVTRSPLFFCYHSISFRSVVFCSLENPCPSRVVARLRARINRRVPTLTVSNEPPSMERKSVALPIPVISQNSAIVYVTRVSSTMRFSRGRRGLGSIDARRVVHFRSFRRLRPHLGDEAEPFVGSQITHTGATRQSSASGQPLRGFLSLAFLGEQGQQHVVPILVARRIALTCGGTR